MVADLRAPVKQARTNGRQTGTHECIDLAYSFEREVKSAREFGRRKSKLSIPRKLRSCVGCKGEHIAPVSIESCFFINQKKNLSWCKLKKVLGPAAVTEIGMHIDRRCLMK